MLKFFEITLNPEGAYKNSMGNDLLYCLCFGPTKIRCFSLINSDVNYELPSRNRNPIALVSYFFLKRNKTPQMESLLSELNL